MYYEDIEVDARLESPWVVVSAEDIVSFAEAWDPHPFHLSVDAGERSIFGGLAACAAHIFALQSRLTHDLPAQAALVAGLAIFFHKTPVGRALRAVADDHQAAMSVGIPLKTIWIIVWAGAGIVADSVAENEYYETIHKASALYDAIRRAELRSARAGKDGAGGAS